MPRVSVIMPSYNHARYIGEAIESVLAQTMPDFELIIVDDGSSDNSREVIAGYRDRDPRITFLPFEKNRGAYTAINDALTHARGDFIAHLNSDDRFLPDKLERQLAILDARPEVGICFSTCEVIDEHGRTMPDSEYVKIFAPRNMDRHGWLRYLFTQNCLCHPSMLARREIMEKAGPYDDRYRQQADLDLWIRIAMLCEIHVMEQPTLQFRDHGLNTGGRSLPTRHRSAQERRFLCERYFAIKDVNEIFAVFPDLRKVVQRPVPGTTEFLIAMQALTVSRRQFSIMGIETLFRLMNDPAQRALLKSAYNFSMVDLHDLAGRTDCFAADIFTQIRFGTIDTARNLKVIDDRYLVDSNIDLRFPLPRGPGMIGYFINMFSIPTAFTVDRITFVAEDRSEQPVPKWQNNAHPPSPVDGVMYFPIYPAQIVIPIAIVPPGAVALRICGRLIAGGADVLQKCFDRIEAAAKT